MTSPRRNLSVLVVEDWPDDAELVVRELRRAGYDVLYERVETAETMREALERRSWDLVISDFSMPHFSATEALRVLRGSGSDLPFIIVSGTIGEEVAVGALKAGANDFMVKGRLVRLPSAVERELADAELRSRGRRAEEALRTSEARFRAIMESATSAVVSADADGRIVLVNPAGERMFGRRAEDLVGQPVTRLIPQRLHAAYQADFSRYLTSGISELVGKVVELSGLRSDGSEFPLELSLGTWVSGGRRSFAGFLQDLTERKRVESQLITSDRMATMGLLAAGVAHEINNPLAAVIANLDLALGEVGGAEPAGAAGELPQRIADELRDARDAARAVRQIVRDLRVFSRGEVERPGPVDVQRVLESTLRMAWNEIRHRARVVKAYAAVPPVVASEARLGQVFLNLLINAAQALPEGAADRHVITVTTCAGEHRVFVEVRDTGPGIAPEILPQLFRPFVTTKAPGEGTGLGLSICHRIVTGLGGEISVVSEPGQGAAFLVALPAAPEDAPPAPAREAPLPAPRRGRVLVIDDEPIIGKLMERALESEHEVVALGDARRALELLRSGESFDVILCDLMMPEMTGIEFHAELQKLDPELAGNVIFLTGGAFTNSASAFLASVRNLHVEKPFDLKQVRSLIHDRLR